MNCIHQILDLFYMVFFTTLIMERNIKTFFYSPRWKEFSYTSNDEVISRKFTRKSYGETPMEIWKFENLEIWTYQKKKGGCVSSQDWMECVEKKWSTKQLKINKKKIELSKKGGLRNLLKLKRKVWIKILIELFIIQ